eukprot:2620582-Amphidinium_carterae.1
MELAIGWHKGHGWLGARCVKHGASLQDRLCMNHKDLAWHPSFTPVFCCSRTCSTTQTNTASTPCLSTPPALHVATRKAHYGGHNNFASFAHGKDYAHLPTWT